jgi:leucine-rich repeat protein SHOC2
MGSGISSEWSVRNRITEQSQEQDPLLRVSIASMGVAQMPVISNLCPMVTALDVSNNMIAALPDHLQRLYLLAVLDVSTNQLAALPTFLGSFTSLTDLRASDNNITELPESLSMSGLTSLSLCRNYLYIPPPLTTIPLLCINHCSCAGTTACPPSSANRFTRRLRLCCCLTTG